MKISHLIILLFFMQTTLLPAQIFKQKQKKYSRVRTAYKEKEVELLNKAKSLNFKGLNNKIFIRIFKKEELLQVWAKQGQQYILFREYPFSAMSGKLGPKRQEGDLQIPEGFYHINLFNPTSSFYLSLQVSYPNKSDRILGVHGSLGGQIFLHGAACTIGCVPITDDKIKELYLLAVEARNAGQKQIPVHIFPTKLTNEFLLAQKNSPHIDFWKNLQAGYNYFETNKKLPRVRTDSKGLYLFK